MVCARIEVARLQPANDIVTIDTNQPARRLTLLHTSISFKEAQFAPFAISPLWRTDTKPKTVYARHASPVLLGRVHEAGESTNRVDDDDFLPYWNA